MHRIDLPTGQHVRVFIYTASQVRQTFCIGGIEIPRKPALKHPMIPKHPEDIGSVDGGPVLGLGPELHALSPKSIDLWNTVVGSNVRVNRMS